MPCMAHGKMKAPPEKGELLYLQRVRLCVLRELFRYDSTLRYSLSARSKKLNCNHWAAHQSRIRKPQRGFLRYLSRKIHPQSVWHIPCRWSKHLVLRWGFTSSCWPSQISRRHCTLLQPLTKCSPIAGYLARSFSEHLLSQKASHSSKTITITIKAFLNIHILFQL